jgi:DNA repair protein RadD
LQAASDKDQLNEAIAKEISIAARGRKATLVFCAGVEHAEHMATQLTAKGLKSRAVHSRLGTAERDAIIAAFKSGRLDAVTNNNVLTTGFDFPAIDLIGMCRATVSVGLWVQMLGRGTRPSPGKKDCLVLDFAGNRARLGPIDAPYVPKAKTSDKTGEIPVKVCDACGCYAHISARVCECCGAPFPIQTKLTPWAGDEAIMSTDTPVIETLPVTNVFYNKHNRRSDGTPTVRIDYMCGYRRYSKWINFEDRRQKHFAHEWWRQFVGDDAPDDNENALQLLNKGIAVSPKRVKVWMNKGKYPEIMGFEL